MYLIASYPTIYISEIWAENKVRYVGSDSASVLEVIITLGNTGIKLLYSFFDHF